MENINLAVISDDEHDISEELYQEVKAYVVQLEKENRLRFQHCFDGANEILIGDSRFKICFMVRSYYDKFYGNRKWAIRETCPDIEFKEKYKRLLDNMILEYDQQAAVDADSKKVRMNIMVMMANPDSRPAIQSFLDEVYEVTGLDVKTIRANTYLIGDNICQITCLFKDGWTGSNFYKSDFDGIIVKPETLRTHHTAFVQVIRSFAQVRGGTDSGS